MMDQDDGPRWWTKMMGQDVAEYDSRVASAEKTLQFFEFTEFTK